MEGKTFEESDIYKSNKDKIHALIKIPKVSYDTYGVDVENMLKQHLTFEEAINDPTRSIMERQRLTMTWRDMKTLLDHSQIG